MAILENRPKIRPAPMAMSPQILNKSTQYKIFGLVASFRNKSENGPSESKRKPTLDQLAFISFARPSYKKCQPITTLKDTSQNNWGFVYFI